MRYLAVGRMIVTGGTGLIGIALIWELNRRGFENILVTDRTEKWKNLVPLRFEDFMKPMSWKTIWRPRPAFRHPHRVPPGRVLVHH